MKGREEEGEEWSREVDGSGEGGWEAKVGNGGRERKGDGKEGKDGSEEGERIMRGANVYERGRGRG